MCVQAEVLWHHKYFWCQLKKVWCKKLQPPGGKELRVDFPVKISRFHVRVRWNHTSNIREEGFFPLAKPLGCIFYSNCDVSCGCAALWSREALKWRNCDFCSSNRFLLLFWILVQNIELRKTSLCSLILKAEPKMAFFWNFRYLSNFLLSKL